MKDAGTLFPLEVLVHLCKVLELLSILLFFCSSAGRIFVPGMMCSRGFVVEKM